MLFQLPDTKKKHDYVLRQFDRIAARYDLTNDAISLGLHRSWKNLAVETLIVTSEPHVLFTGDAQFKTPKQPSGKYLDVCCGTGDMAIRIAERLAPLGEVTGLDFSSAMLNVAKARAAALNAKKRHGGKIIWQEGDAQSLLFSNDTFDGAIISFGLRNLTNLDIGLAEMARVVKSGGAVVNLDLGRPEGIVFAPIFHLFFRHVVPIIGQLLQNDRKAYTYLPESMNTYPDPEGITRLFEQVGLKEVRHIPLSSGSVALHVGVVA